MSKYIIELVQQSNSFKQTPPSVELDADKIAEFDAHLGGYNPHGKSLWVIGDVSGGICAAWADHEQAALDAAVNANLLDEYAYEPEEGEEMDENGEYPSAYGEVITAGNASEPFQFDQPWIARALPLPKQSPALMIAMAWCVGSNVDTLDDFNG